jgi:hypothetical protein
VVTSDDPIFDGTDGAHPAWWRGHDHAAAQLVAQRDAARDQAAAATADALAAERERDALTTALSAMLDMATRLTAQRDALREQIEGRATPPTDAEIEALVEALGAERVTDLECPPEFGPTTVPSPEGSC